MVVGKLLEANKPSNGYDAQSEQYVDMFKEGIIDPVKVVRTALQDAASIAGLLVTTEAMIADKPEEKDAAGGMPAGGICLLYTSPSPRDATLSRMPSSA